MTQTARFSTPRPDFEHPPVIEVLLSVQFAEIAGLVGPHIGLLWGLFRHEFPEIEEKPPIAHIVERFDAPGLPKASMELRMNPPPSRYWFKTPNNECMIQVQKDRFVFNWKSVEGKVYPRFEWVSNRFFEEFEKFQNFIVNNNIGNIVPDQCEVAYVNHVPVGAFPENFSGVDKILNPWSGKFSDDFLEPPEEVRITTRHIIRSDKGDPVGRLHIEIDPRFTVPELSPLLRINMTARCAPLSKDNKGIEETFLLCREYIVRGFASVTTVDAHRYWGRNDV